MAERKPNDPLLKLQKAEDARKAAAEYQAAAAAVDANMERLRAQRLEREAAMANAAPEPKPAKKKPVRKAKS